ncbi:endonuclease/exonuclease/phosphatase family protein [Flavobacterium rhizosphaerae]|uniref:Endonuclease/exonuclease/phosphatase family protein n=1 Tax=Flavobacterium rhizosphaerae TaxID=3163298 RepID=A0ABW8YTI9_9FLAO
MDIFLTILVVISLLFTILSIIRNDNWAFRIFDYPRLQKFVFSFLCLLLLFIFFKNTLYYYILIVLVLINILYIGYLIFPFTFFAKKQVLNASSVKDEDTLSIMIANVYQDNTNYSGCLNQIKSANPDIVLLIETNKYWEENTNELSENFAYCKKVPQENTYGMLLYSKYELLNLEVKYLVEDDIPSIHTFIKLKNGVDVRLFAVHPTPPVPNENIRSTERDKELLLVADMAEKCKDPVIVFGDLNDVAWSYTTKLFLKMSGLLDPRKGRGFYNSFHAHYFFMRFPLDHAFISKHFKLVSMKRCKNFNSDHFPIYIKLQYDKNAILQQESMEKDADDVKLANEKKSKI